MALALVYGHACKQDGELGRKLIKRDCPQRTDIRDHAVSVEMTVEVLIGGNMPFEHRHEFAVSLFG